MKTKKILSDVSKRVTRITVALTMFTGIISSAGILFQDDFNGNTLDNSKWDTGVNTIGRTQFGSTPIISNGVATLTFDTHNPDNPGDTFKGTEIKTRTEFNRNTGVDLEARLRVNQQISNGLVAAFFTFGFDDTAKVSDEIDFEFLSNWINNSVNSNRVLLGTWDDFDENNFLPEQNFTTDQFVNGLNVFDFNTYRISWLNDRTDWYVNDELIFSSNEVIPDDPMSLRLNFWAPASSFGIAFDDGLQPTSDPNLNTTYTYEVDFVNVSSNTAIPEPSTYLLVIFGLVCSFWKKIRL